MRFKRPGGSPIVLLRAEITADSFWSELQMSCPSPRTKRPRTIIWPDGIILQFARTEERENWRQKSAPFSVDFLHGIFWLNLSFATRAALKSAGGPWVHSDNWARLLTGAAAVSQCMCIVLGQISSTNPLRLKACTVAPRTRWWEYSEFFVFWPGEAPHLVRCWFCSLIKVNYLAEWWR